jgi:hypothetical protein
MDYSQAAASAIAEMYLNDTYGDCVPAGCSHGDGVFTGNATGGSPVIFTATQVEAMYTGMSGGVFNPADPTNTDQGCDPLVALQWWQKNGLLADGSHKIAGYLAVDPSNKVELRSAMALFENLFFCMDLPDAWVNPTPSASGFVWDVAGSPDPSNGHFVVGVGCNTTGIPFATWGMVGTLTYAAIAEYCADANGGELYTVVSQDSIVKGMQKFPFGFNWTQIVSYFDAAGGTVIA